MTMTFCSFSSGSSGNCYLVKSDDTAILIDSGISGRKIFESLKKTGTSPGDLCAVLITHEHSDHIRSLKTLAGRIPQIRAYANGGTWKYIDAFVDERQRSVFETGKAFSINDIEVKPFPLSHDAEEPVGFSFYSGGRQISILTDTGLIDDGIYDEIKDADILVLEANHDVEMLKMGRYPWFLKQRILGSRGHLSNVDAAAAICKLISENGKSRQILLAHLSRENNFPEMAYQTIKNLLEENDYYINTHVRLNIIARDEISALYTV